MPELRIIGAIIGVVACTQLAFTGPPILGAFSGLGAVGCLYYLVERV